MTVPSLVLLRTKGVPTINRDLDSLSGYLNRAQVGLNNKEKKDTL